MEKYVAVKSPTKAKWAVFDSEKRIEITPFIYDMIDTRMSRKGKQKVREIRFKREGLVGKIDADGTEQEVKDTRPVAERQKAKEDQQNAMIENALKGEWWGIAQIGEASFLQTIRFSSLNGGVRMIHFTEDGQQCMYVQLFSPHLMQPLRPNDNITAFLSFETGSASPCSTLPPVFVNHSEDLTKSGKLSIGQYSIGDRYRPLGLTRSILPHGTLKYPTSLVDEVLQLKEAEIDLLKKMEGKPGGATNAQLTIHPTSKVITLTTRFGSEYPIGTIQLETASYALTSDNWIREGNYSLSAVFRDVTYIGPDGNKKTGDVDLCFFSNRKPAFWLKEVVQD